MKKNFSLFFLLLEVVLAHCQIVVSSCDAPDSIMAIYKEDAQRMVLYKTYMYYSPYRDSVNIPDTAVQAIVNPLIAVYNAISLPARDTVVNILNLHAFPLRPLDKFMIIADSNQNYMQQFKVGIIPTGDATVDSLMNLYQISMYAYATWSMIPGNHQVYFETENNYNMPVIASQWSNIPGVSYSLCDMLGGSGDDIMDSIYSDHVNLKYLKGWGDCYAGCTEYRIWEFNVYPDCSVEYVGSYGNDLPLGMNENLQTLIKVSPNPFTQTIKVNGIQTPYSFMIYSLLGQMLMAGNSNSAEIDLSKLLPGIYYLSIDYKTTRITQIICKK
ncbi:MAG: T9SS type A sorting domain-containing protein [Bacteroidales bacterium]|nr:T9SS type A sorting domain-containing protein [Bacteroidales bacterium]